VFLSSLSSAQQPSWDVPAHAGILFDKASLLSAVYLCQILLNSETNVSAEFEEKHRVTFINFQRHAPRLQGKKKVKTIFHFDSRT
jgi:hypothetical protein